MSIAALIFLRLYKIVLYDGINPAVIAYNYNERNLEIIPEAGVVPQAINTSVIFEAKSSSSTNPIVHSTPIEIPFSVVTINTDNNIFVPLSNTIIQIAYPGMYEISWQVSMIENTLQRNTMVSTWLEEDIGGGFFEVLGSRSYLQLVTDYTGASQPSTLATSSIVSVGYVSQFKIMSQELTGVGASQVPNSSRLLIKRLK